MFWIKINDPGLLGLLSIKGTDKSFSTVDSSVPLMHHDPSDPGSLILIQIIAKKRTHDFSSRVLRRYFKVLIQEMDVKADAGFVKALMVLFSSDAIDWSQEVTTTMTKLFLLLFYYPMSLVQKTNDGELVNLSLPKYSKFKYVM